MSTMNKITREKEPSMREMFLQREQARECLTHFLMSIWFWPTRKEFPHFLSERLLERKKSNGMPFERGKTFVVRPSTNPANASLEFQLEVMPRTRRDRQIEAKVRRELRGELTPDRCSRYLSAFFRILEQTAVNGNPSRKDLDTLLDALNERKHYLDWEDNMAKSSSDGSRDVAEKLLEYLRLSSFFGPVHGLCADPECGVMFVRRRGDRKFCHDCSKKHQTYQYRKEYLLQKKREYYQRQAEKDKEFRNKTKSQKGTMHGKTKTGKR